MNEQLHDTHVLTSESRSHNRWLPSCWRKNIDLVRSFLRYWTGGLFFATRKSLAPVIFHRRHTFQNTREEQLHKGCTLSLLDMNSIWPGRFLMIVNTHMDALDPLKFNGFRMAQAAEVHNFVGECLQEISNNELLQNHFKAETNRASLEKGDVIEEVSVCHASDKVHPVSSKTIKLNPFEPEDLQSEAQEVIDVESGKIPVEELVDEEHVEEIAANDIWDRVGLVVLGDFNTGAHSTMYSAFMTTLANGAGDHSPSGGVYRDLYAEANNLRIEEDEEWKSEKHHTYAAGNQMVTYPDDSSRMDHCIALDRVEYVVESKGAHNEMTSYTKLIKFMQMEATDCKIINIDGKSRIHAIRTKISKFHL